MIYKNQEPETANWKSVTTKPGSSTVSHLVKENKKFLLQRQSLFRKALPNKQYYNALYIKKHLDMSSAEDFIASFTMHIWRNMCDVLSDIQNSLVALSITQHNISGGIYTAQNTDKAAV